MKSFLGGARAQAPALKNQAAGAMSQMAESTDSNAGLQAAVVSNTDRSFKPTSLVSNPPKVHELEKYDVMDQMRDRMRVGLKSLIESTVAATTAGVAQLGARGAVLADTLKLLPAVATELSAAIVKVGPLKSHGWKLRRLSDADALVCKMQSVHAETVIRREAPVISDTATTHATEAHLHVTTADLKIDHVKDEIHRVANAFGLDADTMTLLLKATALIQANAGVKIESLLKVQINAMTGIDMTTAGPITQSSTLHSIAASGPITISAPLVSINPVVPVAPAVPAPFVPVVTDVPTGSVRAAEQTKAYNGTNTHGTSIA